MLKAEKKNLAETMANVVHQEEKVDIHQGTKVEMAASTEATTNQDSQGTATQATGLQDATTETDHQDVKVAAVSLASVKAETESRSLADHQEMASAGVVSVNAEADLESQEALAQTDLHLATENQDHQETKD